MQKAFWFLLFQSEDLHVFFFRLVLLSMTYGLQVYKQFEYVILAITVCLFISCSHNLSLT